MPRNAALPLLAAFVLALSLAACSGGDADDADDADALDRPISDSAATGTPGGDGSVPTAGPAVPGGATDGGGERVASEIRVTVTGGPHAGAYEARSPATTCSYGLAGKGAWGNQYSDERADGLTSLQLVVPDAQRAAQGTDRFTLTADFGPLLDGEHLAINTVGGGSGDEGPFGSGRVTIDARPGTPALVTFEGTTADGVQLEGTVRCFEVLRVR